MPFDTKPRDIKPRRRMYMFVAVIFAAGVAIAASYIITAKPGESNDKAVSEVVDPNS
jgi:hypothetical protein